MFLVAEQLIDNTMGQEKPEILVVHKQKLEEFLRGLELWEPFLRGELKCALCEATITLDNIGFIIPSGNDIVLCCSKLECVHKMRKPQEVEEREIEG